MSTIAETEDATSVGREAVIVRDDKTLKRRRAVQDAVQSATSRDILLFLIAFRVLNALSIRTFFQPDEYFQSLEPAWHLAFGNNSGAWITWEWKHRLRSAIHPVIFAVVYYIASTFSQMLQLSPAYRADLLIAAPKVLQAIFAAFGDHYTWKLAEKVYGHGSNEAWAALALTVCSPWQWFCAPRTFSNSLETTLTIIALELWPFKRTEDTVEDGADDNVPVQTGKEGSNGYGVLQDLAQLRTALLLAALASILRPTNLLIWLCIGLFSFVNASKKERMILVREALLCGSSILILSSFLDRLYYHTWTFPPLRFLYFNIAQSLAVIYGKNDWHYYLTQGFPALLTTCIPFAVTGLYRALTAPSRTSTLNTVNTTATTAIKYELAVSIIIVPTVLSFVSHKEMRFIYPLLPIVHILAAQPFTTYFLPAVSPASDVHNTLASRLKIALLIFIVALNAFIGYYGTSVHQAGVVSVHDYLRHQHEQHYLTQPPSLLHIAPADTTMTVGFLMPCHSTPWRSHLVHPGIKAWALECEPPVNMNATERAGYVDEADRFYANPIAFLSQEMGPQPRERSSLGFRLPRLGLGQGAVYMGDSTDGTRDIKQWPEYLVFFEQAQETMRTFLKGSGYQECWRGFNSHGHDDWRRKGDVIVWCLRKCSEGKSG